jgi:GNAT superfamily N-acetyltransferase
MGYNLKHMTIRLATPQDKDQVLGLFNEFSAMFHSEDKPSQVGSEIFDEIMSRNDTMIFVAGAEGKLQGLVTFYLLPNVRHGWHRGHIEDFFVTSSARHRGVGTLLFDYIKDYCRNNNVKVVKLDSGNELASAHRFYEKNGGKTTERFFRFDID